MNSTRTQEQNLLQAALALESEPQREAFLNAACAHDRALNRRIRELLAAGGEAEAFFQEAPLKHAGLELNVAAPTVRQEPPADEAPGERIGRYKLLQKIGEGGMGVIYMAEQEEPVRRRVALKIIRFGMDTRQVVARFEAERQALALMDHPNIARVLDGGATGAGRPYFVMELVQGVPITEFCDKNKLPAKERLRLFIQVCQAIQSAHQKGIIHRDIKPSNILVTLHHGEPMPKVIDFGVAKATNQKLTEKTLFTNYATMIGTPAYMSPEQAEMSSMDLDTRTDVYALGVLLYELLTGSTPFPEKRLRSLGYGEMQRVIVEEEPERPSTRLSTMANEAKSAVAKNRSEELGSLSRLLRGDLDWVVMKCLEKDRRRRYDTPNELVADLQRHLKSEPVLARPPSAAYQFQKLVRRNRLAFGATAAIAAALLIGLGVSTWSFLNERQARHRAVSAEREQSRLREEAVKAQAREFHLRRQAEGQAYASDINLAQQALAVNSLGRAQDLLNRHRPKAKTEIDLRGWEWRYLWKQCQSDALYTLCQKSNMIESLAVSPDGKWLAVGEEYSGGLSVWDLRRHEEVLSRRAGTHRVRVAFSPREPLLAFTSTTLGVSNPQYRIHLLNPLTGQTIVELQLRGPCNGLAFFSDGKKLVTYSREGIEGVMAEVAIWGVHDGRKLAEYPASFSYSYGTHFAFAEPLNLAAHVTPDGGLRVLDLATGNERWKVKAAEELVLALAFSPDGKVLASAGGYAESSIRLWEVATGEEIKRLDGHRQGVSALVFWPDGKTLASASNDQTIRLWDMVSLSPRSVLLGHRDEVKRLALMPDGTTLVSGGRDGSVNFWDTTAIRREREHASLPVPVNDWRFASDSKSVLAVDQQGRVAQWQGRDFQEMHALLEVGTNTCGTSISDDGSLLAAGYTSGAVQIWDLVRRNPPRQFTVSNGPVHPSQFLAHGGSLVTISADDQLFHECDIGTWHETRSWRPRVNHSVIFSRNGLWCLEINRGDDPGFLRNMATGQETSLRNPQSSWGGAFSQDAKLFAVFTYRGVVKLGDTATGRDLGLLRGTATAFHSVAFSPDGKCVAAGSVGNNAINLWDVESEQQLLALEGRGSAFDSTAFSPDGNIIGSKNAVGVLQFWRAPSWAEIEAAEKARAKAQ